MVSQLRDVIARLTVEERRGHEPDTAIVYHDDVSGVLMRTIESLAVVTADSQQHQVAADIAKALATLLERLRDAHREQSRAPLRRISTVRSQLTQLLSAGRVDRGHG